MESIEIWIQKERESLLELQLECHDGLSSAPDGFIRAVKHGNGYQYYRKDVLGGSANESYVKKKDLNIVQSIVKRDYCRMMEKYVNKKIAALNRFEKQYLSTNLSQVYDSMSEGRKQLIQPLVLSDQQYIENWLDVEFESKKLYEDTPEIITDKGERVRSKSEKIIADKLFREGIPYRYEYPLELRGYGVVYPDFCVLNVRRRQDIYWEHLGMMDDVDYCDKALRKIECYERNGFYPGKNLLITHETSARPLNSQLISELIDEFLR